MNNFFKWLNKGWYQFIFGIKFGAMIIALMSIYHSKAEAKPYVHSCEFKERQTEYSALACNIYFEARGEIKADKLGVGFTSLNRLKTERFRGTLIDIIYKPYAFSWTNDGKTDRVYDLDAWSDSLQIAAWLLSLSPAQYELLDVTDGALFYHRYDMKKFPSWASSEYFIGQIGEHRYYFNDVKA